MGKLANYASTVALGLILGGACLGLLYDKKFNKCVCPKNGWEELKPHALTSQQNPDKTKYKTVRDDAINLFNFLLLNQNNMNTANMDKAKTLSKKLSDDINTLVSSVSKDEAKQKLVTYLYDSSYNTLLNIQDYIINNMNKHIQKTDEKTFIYFTGNTRTQIYNNYDKIENPIKLYSGKIIGGLPQIIYALQ